MHDLEFAVLGGRDPFLFTAVKDDDDLTGVSVLDNSADGQVELARRAVIVPDVVSLRNDDHREARAEVYDV